MRVFIDTPLRRYLNSRYIILNHPRDVIHNILQQINNSWVFATCMHLSAKQPIILVRKLLVDYAHTYVQVYDILLYVHIVHIK